MDELKPLSERVPIKKHRLFIDELFKCNMHQAQAYLNVYGGDYDNARARSSGLVAKRNIAEEIERRLSEKAMTANEVIARLAEQAQAQYSDYISPDGTVDLGRLLEDGKGHLIKKTKHNKDGKLEVEFYDAQSALVHIGKIHSLFTDRVEHTGEVEHKVKVIGGLDLDDI